MTAKHPDLKPIESSALSAWHYDPATQVFHAQFSTDGPVWAYDGVDQMHATQFEHAASKGSYFAKQIKGKHTGRKVT